MYVEFFALLQEVAGHNELDGVQFAEWGEFCSIEVEIVLCEAELGAGVTRITVQTVLIAEHAGYGVALCAILGVEG